MIRQCAIVLLGIVGFSVSGFSQILPQNSLHLQDCIECLTVGVTEKEFNSVIDKADAVYAPIVKTHGAYLNFNRLWTDSTVNASAYQSGDDWEVNMYGGLARRPEVTVDGFTLVVCHELGHHLAGFPYSSWAANEGQSDFFATHKCAPTLWAEDKAENAKAREVVDAEPKKQCDEIYKTEDAQNLCYRIAMAGKSLANLLGALNGKTPDWSTPDTRVVRRTDNNHPQAQCRLDTYMAGAVCLSEFDKMVIPGTGNSLKSEEESSLHHCTKSRQFDVGLRPTCWFKPRL